MTAEPERFAPIPIVSSAIDRRERRKSIAAVVAICAATLLVAGGVFAALMWRTTAATAPVVRKTALRVAHESCGNVGELTDADLTLFLDMAGEDANSGTLDQSDIACVLTALGTPSYVTREMGQTRALDGRLTQSWGAFEASWSYHPDDGLDVLVREHT